MKTLLPIISIASLSLILSCENPAGNDSESNSGTVTPETGVKTAVEMLAVPGGTFTMGSLIGSLYPKQKEPHEVKVSAFEIGKYEITQKQFEEVLGWNHSYNKGESLPVQSVTWYDALLFCNALSKQHGLDTVYSYRSVTKSDTSEHVVKLGGHSFHRDRNGYRLPTEAEWEFACRGGYDTEYYWGVDTATDDETELYIVHSGNTTAPIGSKLPNKYELYDMLGNVSEWCYDEWEDYVTTGIQVNPVGKAMYSDDRIRRGGSIGAVPSSCTERFYSEPGNTYYATGFRVVKGAIVTE